VYLSFLGSVATTSIEIESHSRVVVVGRGPFNQLSNENVKISKVKKAK